jgi:hypothetical protein
MIIAALLIIGFILGAIGGGAGLLILPVLVYHQNFSSIEAAPISMSLVGVSAMITLLSQRTSWKEWWSKDLITFIGGSLFMIYLTKWLLMYLKTNVLATKEGVEQLDHFIMLLFIPIIFFSAWHAWPRKSFTQNTTVWNRSKGWGWGMLTGSLAGIFGAGGGFIIVPVLHQGAQFPIQKAIGASLLIITINGTLGGLTPLIIGHQMNFTIFIWMIWMAAGAITGRVWSKNQTPEVLKKSLAIFLSVVATAIFVKEINHLL